TGAVCACWTRVERRPECSPPSPSPSSSCSREARVGSTDEVLLASAEAPVELGWVSAMPPAAPRAPAVPATITAAEAARARRTLLDLEFMGFTVPPESVRILWAA
ncbi:MAG TPA: hypothetical protein PKK40_05070, partial [Marmoricola sp.]|nr:hypothetical protein [Marmoricola sp.]